MGYSINQHGIAPPTERISAVSNYPKPQTIQELRRFLGVINYYRRCIPKAAHMQAILNDYTRDSKKNDTRPVLWTPEAEQAFEDCKNSLRNAIVLAHPSSNVPLALVTDASDVALGAALEQQVDNAWQPLGFFSRKLSKAETKYSTYDRELLAIYEAIRHFRHLLDARHFVVKTDHKPLIYAFQQKMEKASPRQLTHLDFISQFTTEIIHLAGSENIVADALSRLNAISMPTSISYEELQKAQEEDAELPDIANGSTSLKLQIVHFENSKIYCDISSGIVRPYIPRNLRFNVFSSIHNLSHPSGRATQQEIRQKYVWPNMKKDVILWARSCLQCQRAKIHRHNKLNPLKIQMPDQRFDHVHLDLVVMPEINGFRYCLTMIDRYTRWPEAIPLKNMTADTVATAFWTHWISRFGCPKVITTDQGSQFESTLFKALTNLVGCKRTRTTAYHPQTNSMVERWHRSFKAALMCHDRSWPDMLPTVLLGLRTCFKEDIRATAAELVYGSSIRLPNEFFDNVDMPADPQIFVEKFREHMRLLRPTPAAHHVRKKSMFILKDIQNCSHVFLRTDHVKEPLEKPYTGPFQVIDRPTDRVFTIRIDNKDSNVSIERLKPAYFVKETPTQPDVQQPSNLTSRPPRTYLKKDRVKFAMDRVKVTRGGVDVAAPPTQH